MWNEIKMNPIVNGDYLITDGICISVASYECGEWVVPMWLFSLSDDMCSVGFDFIPTHWMFLPAPPKSDNFEAVKPSHNTARQAPEASAQICPYCKTKLSSIESEALQCSSCGNSWDRSGKLLPLQ